MEIESTKSICRSKGIPFSPFLHLYPFRSRRLNIKGYRLHYIDEGRGAPIIMLHGNPTWSFYYRALIRGLSPYYRTIVPDHMGCGLSDVPDPSAYGYRLRHRVDDFHALMANIAADPPLTLILHDWGGMIGLVYALENLKNIGRIVVLNTSGFLPPGSKNLPFRLWLLRRFSQLAGPAVLGLNLFARSASWMATGGTLPRDVRKGLIAPYNTWSNRMATLRFVEDIPLGPKDPSYALVKYVDDHLDRLSGIPMLICWGGKDFVFDLDYFQEWKRRFPDAEAYLIEKAGHYVLEDAPCTVLARIKDFLKRNPL
jgi:cis-3-alkyl-4-acyloxetan-2-one decarboxylase